MSGKNSVGIGACMALGLMLSPCVSAGVVNGVLSQWNLQVDECEDEQLDLVREAERTLSTDVVLAFRPADDGPLHDGDRAPGVEPAALDESQLECLQGLESRFDAVLVAYRRVDA